MIEWNVQGIEAARELWDRVESDVADCIATGPLTNTSIDTVKQHVLAGNLILCAAYEDAELRGAAVVRIADVLDTKMAYAISVTGSGLANPASADNFFAMLRRLGAKHVQAVCRPAAAKLWGRVGFKTTHEIMEVNLWADL
jgi:hypothetical protein